jgi:hypothetical protein
MEINCPNCQVTIDIKDKQFSVHTTDDLGFQFDIRGYLVNKIDSHFLINKEEAIALNKLLQTHAGLFREQEEYIYLLRLINGLNTFIDKQK